MRELPTPFPHCYDKDAEIARAFEGGRAWPTTAFYNAGGKLTRTHLGAYATEAKLEEDIGSPNGAYCSGSGRRSSSR